MGHVIQERRCRESRVKIMTNSSKSLGRVQTEGHIWIIIGILVPYGTVTVCKRLLLRGFLTCASALKQSRSSLGAVARVRGWRQVPVHKSRLSCRSEGGQQDA